jgi:hypothetical protein
MVSFSKNKVPFEDIDDINTKITGLIKSISMSCQKKGRGSVAKF